MFRVTTYELGAGAFTGTSHTLTLNQDLSSNYLVFVRGSVDAAAASPSNTGVRVTADPFGTGDLGTSGGSDQLTLTRKDASEGDWQGTVTVWEPPFLRCPRILL